MVAVASYTAEAMIYAYFATHDTTFSAKEAQGKQFLVLQLKSTVLFTSRQIFFASYSWRPPGSSNMYIISYIGQLIHFPFIYSVFQLHH